MAVTKDYIPKPHHLFNSWQINLVTRATANAVAWNIPAGKITAITAAQGIYQPFYTAIANPSDRSKTANNSHVQARRIYQPLLRTFVKENLRYNTVITAGEKSQLGINNGLNTAGERPQILTSPHLSLQSKDNMLVIVECRVESDSSRPSIHPDADGVEIVGSIGLVAPASHQDCIKLGIVTKARIKHIHDEPADSGKFFYVFARWVNLTDETKNGPWSNIASARFL